jgi:hypothetical protein
MKWLRTIIVFDKGNVVAELDWTAVHGSYVRSIEAIKHPANSEKFTLRRKLHLPNGQWKRNGVGYMRSSFLRQMVDVEKWHREAAVELRRDRIQPTLRLYPKGDAYQEPITSDFGGFDFQTVTKEGLRVVIEWETGNISSSHRSMNKLAIALASGVIQVGVLIVPSRACYDQLTDRIGNIGELSGYLELWEAAKAAVKRGLLAISVVEHDAITDDQSVPYLKVGDDGRAKKAKAQAAKSKRKLKGRSE